MTDPQRYPVETARKKIADILDGTQFRGETAEITRRDKRAGYLVPPEWYDEAVEAIAEKRRKAVGAPPAAAAPRPRVTQALPKPVPSISPKVRALPSDRVRWLAEKAEEQQLDWVAELRSEYPHLKGPDWDYVVVETGLQKGLKIPELADEPATDPSERPMDDKEQTA